MVKEDSDLCFVRTQILRIKQKLSETVIIKMIYIFINNFCFKKTIGINYLENILVD